jgi:putative ABC transport system ATP-binding protein
MEAALTTLDEPIVRAPVVTASDVSRVFGVGDSAVRALCDVSVELERGLLTAVMGPSGSGKSTLMHILAGLDRPTSGSVTFGGTDITAVGDDELTRLRQRHVGFVFQFFNLLPTLTAAENVLLPALIAGERAARREARAAELLELVGLADRAEHLPAQLSGGEQQRISIARALLREPDLVLADEPTGNLDTRSGQVVLDLLRRIADGGQTVVMVSHDPNAASRADRVVFLRDGRVAGEVAGGDAEAVVARFRELGAAEPAA